MSTLLRLQSLNLPKSQQALGREQQTVTSATSRHEERCSHVLFLKDFHSAGIPASCTQRCLCSKENTHKKKPKDFSYSLYHTNKKSRKKRKVQKEELSRIAPFLG